MLARCASVLRGILGALLVGGGSLVAQCALQWQAGESIPGVDGTVAAVTIWDRDGPGPAPSLVVVAGHFAVAGGVAASNVAAFDPATNVWSALGSGTNGAVRAVTILANGDLVVGGAFNSAGGVPAYAIARWDGATWSGLAAPFVGDVKALATMPNGDLIASGFGGPGFGSLLRWDGSTWSGLGVGGSVYAMVLLPNGDLVIGGVAITAPVSGYPSVVRWNGSTWTALGPLFQKNGSGASVSALTVTSGGTIVVGGDFTHIGGVATNRVAVWNGNAWQPLGAGPGGTGSVHSLAAPSNGDLWAACPSLQAPVLARWDGSSWSQVAGAADAYVSALHAASTGEVIAGGSFLGIGTVPVGSVARWSAGTWSSLGSGTNGSVRSFARLPDGDAIAFGEFTSIGGVAANRIARRHGAGWSPLGAGADGPVTAALALPNGDVVAAGWFAVGGVNAKRVARWNGSTWSPLGVAIGGDVESLVALPNGDVVAGGGFAIPGAANLARWDGSTWSALGTQAVPIVHAMTVLANGELLVSGVAAGAWLARWDGSAWSSLPSVPNNAVTALTTLTDGSVVAAGWFTQAGGLPANGVARWDGSSWSALGSGISGLVTSVFALPDGDLAVTGELTAVGGGTSGILRWDGAVWSPLGPSATGILGAAMLPGGELAVGVYRGLASAGTHRGAYLGRLASTCPATTVAFGSGCAGSAGPNVLAPVTSPWLGSTLRVRATGLPATGIAVVVTGFTTVALPLANVLPYAVPGCDLFVAPDFLDALIPAAGAVTADLALPASTAFVGVQLHRQVVALEVGAGGRFVAATSTNALSMTLGVF